MTDTSMFGELIQEDIPAAPPRPPGKGREPVKWEDHLAPLESTLFEKPHRLWSYEMKTGATSRMSAVRGRLNTAAPSKNWEFKVRPVPGSDLWGVYAVFHGEYSPDEQLSKAQKRQEHSAKLAAARDAKEATPTATSEPGEVETATEAPQTAKEKLAAKAASK